MSRSRQKKERAPKAAGTTTFLSRLRLALAWPGLYGWIGIVFGVSGLWFLPSGLVLRGRAAILSEEGPRAHEAAQSARHLGFGEMEPTETLVRTRTGVDKKRWSPPFGFMAPSVRRERSEGGVGNIGREERPVYMVPDPLTDRTLVRAHEGARANARASIVFGVFCLAVSGFWWGFRLLDPVARLSEAARAGKDGSPSGRKAP